MRCLALLFNRYKDNVPRFPGTCKTLYFLSLELWTMIHKALFIPTQVTPQVSHPSPPPAYPLSMQKGRIIPFKKHIILFHLHQYMCPSPMLLLLPGIVRQFYFQKYPWLAQSCPSRY